MKVTKAFISQVLRCLINFLPSPSCSQPETIIKEDVLVVRVCGREISPSDAVGTCAAVHRQGCGCPRGKAAPQSGTRRRGALQEAVLPGAQFSLEGCL